MTGFKFIDAASIGPDHTVLDLVDAIDGASELSDEERTIGRELVFKHCFEGGQDASEFTKAFASVTDAERGALIDEVRIEAGMPTLEAERQNEIFEAANQKRHSGHHLCSAEGCMATPISETGGQIELAVRRWWCPEHQHLAGPRDHLPPAPVRVDPRTMPIAPHTFCSLDSRRG